MLLLAKLSLPILRCFTSVETGTSRSCFQLVVSSCAWSLRNTLPSLSQHGVFRRLHTHDIFGHGLLRTRSLSTDAVLVRTAAVAGCPIGSNSFVALPSCCSGPSLDLSTVHRWTSIHCSRLAAPDRGAARTVAWESMPGKPFPNRVLRCHRSAAASIASQPGRD